MPDDRIFLDYILRSALTAPGAATDPVAGRFLARLFATVASEAGEQQITGYLAPTPQPEAIFEVRVFRAGNLTPTTVTSDLGAVAALKMAHRLAHEQNEGVEVLSRAPRTEVGVPGSPGVERCVFVRDSTGELEYRFVCAETLLGDPEACLEAQRAWTETLDEWAAWVSREQGPEGTGAVPAVGATDMPRGGASSPGASSPKPTGSSAGPSAPSPSVDKPVATESLIETLEGFFSNLTVEVDLVQIEQLVRQAVDRDRQQTIEPIAARVAEILRASLPTKPARPDAVQPPPVLVGVPTSAEVAEVVSAQVGALLSETILSRRYGEASGQHSALRALVTAVDQLDVQLNGLRDEVRRSAGILTELSDNVGAGDRRAAIAERVATSVDQEMQRLANRIDEQVTALTTTAGGGSELSDGVARLTRKLRQSVAQLDRTLLRLDEVVDQVGSNGGNRQVVVRDGSLARGSTPDPRRPTPDSPAVSRGGGAVPPDGSPAVSRGGGVAPRGGGAAPEPSRSPAPERRRPGLPGPTGSVGPVVRR